MRMALFEPLPAREQKRVSVQMAVNQWAKEEWPGSTPKIYCLSNYTLFGLEVFLCFHMMKKKLRPAIEFSDYNVVVQTLLCNSSTLYSSEPDFVVMSLDLRSMVPAYYLNMWDAEKIASVLLNILNLLKRKVSKPVMVTDFLLPQTGDRYTESSLDNKVDLLNRRLHTFIERNREQFFLLDMNRILALTGVLESLDEKLWYQSKAPYKSPFLSRLAREVATIVGAHYGASKKCIILDCDNTLWGGVIGEDGLTGIALNSNEYPGVAFYEFQQYLLNLYSRGVLLAICSKNNEQDVLQVLDEHPHCLLKREHFCCIKANWGNKVDNINAISNTLHLGLNNFLFIDDSPVECGSVEQLLPDLDISLTPKNPLDFKYIRQAENIFFNPQHTAEDGRKQEQYQNHAKRQESTASFADMTAFLKSLDTCVNFFLNSPAQLKRIAQLTQKTNQFNVRTIRYTVQDISAFMKSPEHLVFSMRVKDKFGDLGVTNVCIVSLNGDGVAFIDTFLMSCRAIKRGLEFFFFNLCVQVLKTNFDVTSIRAEYIPSDKNMLVENFWRDAGLEKISVDQNGGTIYGESVKQIKYVSNDYIHLTESNS